MASARVFQMFRLICKLALGVWVLAVSVHTGESVYKTGDVFQDCDVCPAMVVIPPGSFMMGSPTNEPLRNSNEDPEHRVTIQHTFAVGKFEVTQREWKAPMGSNPSQFKEPFDQIPHVHVGQGQQVPDKRTFLRLFEVLLAKQ